MIHQTSAVGQGAPVAGRSATGDTRQGAVEKLRVWFAYTVVLSIIVLNKAYYLQKELLHTNPIITVTLKGV